MSFWPILILIKASILRLHGSFPLSGCIICLLADNRESSDFQAAISRSNASTLGKAETCGARHILNVNHQNSHL
jgi:hypothetical protein